MRKILFIISGIIFFSSCEGLLTERYPIYQDNVESLLVLNGIFSTADLQHRFYVGQNQTYSNDLDPYQNLTVYDADCHIQINNNAYQAFYTDSIGYYTFSLPSLDSISDQDTIQVTAAMQGFDDAISKIAVPRNDENFTYSITQNQQSSYSLQIRIQDSQNYIDY